MVSSFVRSFIDLCFNSCDHFFWLKKNICQSFTCHGGGVPRRIGILNSELANCPRTVAVLGELATQWQQMMEALQRIEQEAMSSKNVGNSIEDLSRTRSEVRGSRLRLKDGERLYPKSWSGNTPLGGLAREVAAWLVYVDPEA